MSHFLDVIKQKVNERVKTMRVAEGNPDLPAIDFCGIFAPSSAPVVISEIKFASPSRGSIYQGSLSHVQIAAQYMQHGASALSVLTEPEFFKGDIQYIRDIRSALPQAPILLKDFVLAPIQIQQAKAFGANAVLLIEAFLSPSLLRELYDYALSLGLTPLIEVHDERELEQAMMLQPKVIGVNNRNLKTLKIDLETARRLIRLVPRHVLAVCESGVTSNAEIMDMSSRGYDGFLIGSHLMQTENPGNALSLLLNGEMHAG
jgi:indole-3-glycerol phosphate synthase